jgi:hypothetical protein
MPLRHTLFSAAFITNTSGFRFSVHTGTSSHSDELTGDFGNEPEAISIGDRSQLRLLAENFSPGNLGLLQQNLPIADIQLIRYPPSLLS